MKARQFLSKAIKRVTKRQPNALPTKVWGTKGFEFWCLLSLLLRKSNCTSILELGTGRSTITLAEYAKFRKAHLTCLETTKPWFNKVRLDLRCLKLQQDVVHLVPLDKKTGWYNLEQFRAATRGTPEIDLLFVDGPNEPEGSSRGIRSSEIGMSEIKACAGNAEVIIVDDVHRLHVLGTLDQMVVDPSRYHRWFYDYVPGKKTNTLCIMAKQGSETSRELPAISKFTGIKLYSAFEPENCRED